MFCMSIDRRCVGTVKFCMCIDRGYGGKGRVSYVLYEY